MKSVTQQATVYLTIILIIIQAILFALSSPAPVQAMKRESITPVEIEILEGRSILVNLPSGVMVLEV